MNGKAQKSQIKWPPLFNFANDKPHIDPSFQNWEKVNGPYLNDMVQPVYTQSAGLSTVFSKDGDAFNIEDGVFKRNGETLWNVDNYKFVKKDVTDEYKEYASWDLSSSHEARLKITSNEYQIYLDGNVITHIARNPNDKPVETRVKIIDNNIWFVLYYDLNNIESVYISRIDIATGTNTVLVQQTATWRKQVISGGSCYYTTVYGVNDVAPCIHIGRCLPSVVGVSLTMNAGTVENTYDKGFITFFISNNDVYEIGRNISANMGTVTANTENVPFALTLTSSTKNVSSSTKIIGVITASSTSRYSVGQTFLYNTGMKFEGETDYIQGFNTYVVSNISGRQLPIYGHGSIANSNLSQSIAFDLYSITVYQREFQITVRGPDEFTYGFVGASSLNDGNTQVQLSTGTIVLEATNGSYTNVVSISPLYIGLGKNADANSPGGCTASFKNEYYSGDFTPYINNWTIKVRMTKDGVSNDFTIDPSYINSERRFEGTYTKSITPVSVANVIGYPNIVMDNGLLYSLYSFTPQVNASGQTNQTTYWSQPIFNQGQVIGVHGSLTAISGGYYTVNATTINPASVNCTAIRSNSYVANQNFFTTTGKFCSTSSTDPVHLSSGTAENVGSRYSEYTYGNYSGIRYMPGTNRLSSFNYYSKALTGDPTIIGASEDLLVFHVGGYRVPIIYDSILTSGFNILYNVFQSGYAYTQGISYSSSSNKMGTLVTPWQSIDEHSYIAANGNKVIYRDKSNKFYEVSIQEGAEISSKVEDRFIVINTTSYWNCYDTKENKKFHYATDYNGRLQHGQNTITSMKGTLAASASGNNAYPFIKYTANGINPMYQVMPCYAISSMTLPIVPRYRVVTGNEIAHNSLVDADLDLQGIDVFYSEQGSTTCKYQSTIIPYSSTSNYVKHQLQGLVYPGSTSTSASLTPNIFTEFINGAGNNDIVLDGYDSYTLTYYDNKPFLIYSAATQVSGVYGNSDAFFVLQGQFYYITGNKLYSAIYSNGAIAQSDAIVDLGDLIYLGNTPMIAFFFDPSSRVIRSFAGDANLETLYSASKFTRMG